MKLSRHAAQRAAERLRASPRTIIKMWQDAKPATRHEVRQFRNMQIHNGLQARIAEGKVLLLADMAQRCIVTIICQEEA